MKIGSKPDKKQKSVKNATVAFRDSGTADRLTNVFRSNTGIYAQVIDVAGVTLAALQLLTKKFQGTKLNKPLLSANSLLNVRLLKVFLKWCSTAVDIYITDVLKLWLMQLVKTVEILIGGHRKWHLKIMQLNLKERYHTWCC